jgi:hypothetical protein
LIWAFFWMVTLGKVRNYNQGNFMNFLRLRALW